MPFGDTDSDTSLHFESDDVEVSETRATADICLVLLMFDAAL